MYISSVVVVVTVILCRNVLTIGCFFALYLLRYIFLLLYSIALSPPFYPYMLQDT